MANSKSTIYPIQLQGAELNLNKYDAEIKQYSGFNKNNSPFVGGCLSNIFIKNSALEDHNDSNTYIAENGDVYTVTADGLFKNSEKLEDYTGKDFIAIEKINAPRDCVKAFAEDLFLKVVDEKVYLNDILISNYNVIPNTDLDTFLTKFSCGVWVGNVFVFAYFAIYNSVYRVVVCALEKNEDNEYVILTRNDVPFIKDYSVHAYNDLHPLAVLATEDEGRTYIQVTYTSQLSGVSVRNWYGYFDDNEVHLETAESPEPVASAYATGWTYNSSTANINEIGDYRISILSYPRNELVYDFLSFEDNSATEQRKQTAIRIKLNVKDNFNNLGNGYVLKNANVLQTLPSPGASSEYTVRHDRSVIKSNLLESSILKCSGMINNVDDYVYGDILETPFFVGKDENDNYITAGGATVLLENCPFGVLINNGVVSGIAACDEIDLDKNLCLTKILVTNWNTVKETTITYIPEEGSSNINLIYGDYDGNFYILKKTDVPALKKVNNQIVTNVLYNHNSYFLNRQESGYFAPGFNVSAIRGNRLILDSDKYFTASINEYKLEDNASILLNPFECCSRYPYLVIEVQRFADVNIYTGSPDCKYYETVKVGYGSNIYDLIINFTNTELKDLPFPIDTNGNISYSPSLFSEIVNVFGNRIMIKENKTLYFLQVYNNEPVMSFYMAGGIENITDSFIIQGQYYVILDNSIYSFQFENGVSGSMQFIVDVSNLQFVGNTPYEALFFSKTNRCLYSFTGANVLNQKQLVDKISEVRNYLYNPATQTVFLITDIGVLFYGLFGIFLLEYTDISKIFLLENGIVMSDNNGNYRYIKYYLDEGDEDFEKQNIILETCFYGMNNEMMTINDCLYFRLFSEEHEEGDLKVKATTVSLSGRKTEETTFKIKASDWDKITHTIYLRYQPKAQRGLGVSFSIDSPFKIASLSVGSQPDAVLVDKVSKGAITAPSVTSNNDEW